MPQPGVLYLTKVPYLFPQKFVRNRISFGQAVTKFIIILSRSFLTPGLTSLM